MAENSMKPGRYEFSECTVKVGGVRFPVQSVIYRDEQTLSEHHERLIRNMAHIVGPQCANRIVAMAEEKARGSTFMDAFGLYLASAYEYVMAGNGCPACETDNRQAKKVAEALTKGMVAGMVRPDHRAEREAKRREIDRVLAEDARRFPAFAMARKCAVMAWAEADPAKASPHLVPSLLFALRCYEDDRGGQRTPQNAVEWESHRDAAALRAYERTRSL